MNAEKIDKMTITATHKYPPRMFLSIEIANKELKRY